LASLIAVIHFASRHGEAICIEGKQTLTSAQIEEARALLRWSQTKLASRPDLSLEKGGVIFVEEIGDGPGVRLNKERRGQLPSIRFRPLQRIN
jgi:hypothetical protein